MDKTEALASTLRSILERDLTPEQIAEMDARNRAETDPGICHSHDFCDSNMLLLESFKEVTGRDPLAGDLLTDEDETLMVKAWSLMRSRVS